MGRGIIEAARIRINDLSCRWRVRGACRLFSAGAYNFRGTDTRVARIIIGIASNCDRRIDNWVQARGVLIELESAARDERLKKRYVEQKERERERKRSKKLEEVKDT